MKIEDLENELYGFKHEKDLENKNDLKNQKVGDLGFEKEERIKTTWAEDLKEEKKSSNNSKNKKFSFFSFLGIIGLMLLIFGGYLFLLIFKKTDNSQVKIEISFPHQEILKGAPFLVVVNVSNQSNEVLKSAVLNLELPKGFLNFNDLADKETEILRENLGDIGVGSFLRKEFRLITFDENLQGSQKIKAYLTYQILNNQRFRQETLAQFSVNKKAIELGVRNQAKVLNESVFEMEIEYQNVSDFDFDNLALEVTYPPDFKFIDADLPPAFLENYWELGALKSQRTARFKIKGLVKAPQMAFFNIPINLYVILNNQKYLLNKIQASFSVAPSPLRFSLTVNGKSDYVAKIGDILNYTLSYKNESDVPLTDVVIKAKITGELFDFKTLSSKGEYDSLNNVLIWNASHVSDLRLLKPGGSGAVNFSINLLKEFPIKKAEDKNYVLRVTAEISSPTVPSYLDMDKTFAETTLETKVSGLILVDAQVFYRDLNSGIINQGELPPKVNQPTQYTVHWLIKNLGTEVKNVEVRTFLQRGVRFTGLTKSDLDLEPFFNERTQEMILRIDKLEANWGVINEPVRVVFQIEATPSLNQVGSYQSLISETRITALDSFTGVLLENFDSPVTTSLPDDPTVGRNDGQVVN